MPSLRIFMAEDSEASRLRLTQDLGGRGDIDIVGSADSEIGAVTWLVRHPQAWDLTILDLASNPESGLRTLAACRVRRPGQKVVVLRQDAASDTLLRRCRGLGADLVIDKLPGHSSLLRYCADLNAGVHRSRSCEFLACLRVRLDRGLSALRSVQLVRSLRFGKR